MKISCGKPVTPLILIVDDDLSTTRTLDGMLRKEGFEILCAHDLAGAQTLVRSRSISLILLDVQLPDGNGLDYCERLMADPSIGEIPILFISANDDVAAKVRGFAAGAVDYITKPLAGAEVLARVHTHLRLRAAYESLAGLHAERIQLLTVSQQSLMPLPEALPGAGFQVCARQIHQAGGDFYDVVPAGNRITDYVVADASGHDLGVSLWTAAFKALLIEYASVVHAPADLCRMINNSMRRVLPDGAYFTALYARLNRATNRLVLANAGHPPAILLSGREREALILHQEGDVLGAFSDVVFGAMEITVRAGDRLFLYTDGLVEIYGTREEGIRRLQDACLSAMELPLEDSVPAIVEELCSGCALQDDIILLGVEV